MSGPQRWNFSVDHEPTDRGDYILYEEHQDIVDKLQTELDEALDRIEELEQDKEDKP